MEEQWKRIPNYSGYEISSWGNIRSFWSKGQYSRIRRKSYIKKQTKNFYGYFIIGMTNDEGKYKTEIVHRLVLLVFKGQSKGLNGLHKNDNKEDNRIENLYWGTQKDNLYDQRQNGIALIGEKCSWAKLKELDIFNIKSIAKEGLSQSKIAKKYNVSSSLISMIINNKRWKYINA